MKKQIAFAFFFAFSVSLYSAEKPSSKAVPLFDPAHPSVESWKDSWGNVPAGAAVKLDGNKMVVSGSLSNLSYGSIYRPIEIDLDQTPYLEMDVESASHHWYLILKGDQLPNGYVKIQQDTDETGIMIYDLRLALGLAGKQSFKELQLGVSTEGNSSGNKGQTLVLKSMKLTSGEEGTQMLQLYGPQNRKLSGWKNTNDDRSPTGVEMMIGSESVTLQVNIPQQSYGMMYKIVNLNFDKTNVLKISVEAVTHHWYIILSHPELNKGFTRIQPDTNLTGTFYYDLKEITGLKGVKDFRLQLGISTHEEKPSALGEKMTFKELTLLAPDQVPQGSRVLKKRDLKFLQKIQSPPPKMIMQLEEAVPVHVAKADLDSHTFASIQPSAPETEILKSISDEFAARFAEENSSKKYDAQEPVFKETAQQLVVQNGFYRIGFSKQNGAIAFVQSPQSSAPVILGNLDGALWRIDCKDRSSMESSGAENFKWDWQANRKELNLRYENKKTPGKIEVRFTFDASDKIKIHSAIENNSDKTFLSFSLPHGLLFSVGNLDRVILPRLIGIAFKPGFFQSQKQWTDHYPPAFADFAWIGTRSGPLTVDMIQRSSETKTDFQPAMLELGSAPDGKRGFYNHKLPICLEPDHRWESPEIELIVGRSVPESVTDYSKENKMDEWPSLQSKLSPDLYEKLIRSTIIRVDQSANVDFASVSNFLNDLPSPSILHLTTFWPGGFDKNYPDYLPPDPEYGSMEDFKNLVSKARQRGMFVMPYTNPTWWNDGPTMKSLTPEEVGLKAFDGRVIEEKYNGNPGTVVSPDHPKVMERNAKTVREFTETVPIDFLFQDQIGARRSIYRQNSERPLSYIQSLIDEAARRSAKMPLMTEGGYDRLIPYEIGFCGMTSLSYPKFKEYDDLWGKGNWEIDPVSLYLAHSKVNFYQHNLSKDVIIDSDAKITWNIAYGFGLITARTYINQNLEKKWIALSDVLQKEALSRILGQELKGFLRLKENATWSRFGEMDVFANFSDDEPLTVGNETIAPQGFMAKSSGGDLVAGLFTRFNGAQLEGRHYLIVKSSVNWIEVRQPDAKTTFITLDRPANWDSNSIRAYRVEKGKEVEAPLAVDANHLTFQFRADSGSEIYRIRYGESGGDAIAFKLNCSAGHLKFGEPIFAEVTVKNNGSNAVSNAKIGCSSWKIASHSAVPEMPRKGDTISNGVPFSMGTEMVSPLTLKPGEEQKVRFKIDLPPAFFFNAKSLWLRARAEYESGGQKMISVMDRKIDAGEW